MRAKFGQNFSDDTELGLFIHRVSGHRPARDDCQVCVLAKAQRHGHDSLGEGLEHIGRVTADCCGAIKPSGHDQVRYFHRFVYELGEDLEYKRSYPIRSKLSATTRKCLLDFEREVRRPATGFKSDNGKE